MNRFNKFNEFISEKWPLRFKIIQNYHFCFTIYPKWSFSLKIHPKWQFWFKIWPWVIKNDQFWFENDPKWLVWIQNSSKLTIFHSQSTQNGLFRLNTSLQMIRTKNGLNSENDYLKFSRNHPTCDCSDFPETGHSDNGFRKLKKKNESFISKNSLLLSLLWFFFKN